MFSKSETLNLSLGYSPCPNDTFIFYALVHGLIETGSWQPAAPRLEDVETLNKWALQKKLDITKLSCHALGHVLNDYVLLRSGGALGKGCGPLVVAGRPMEVGALARARVAIPGRHTTAAMLLKLFAPQCANTVVMRFDQIMPAIARGEVEAGVIIHESRFTYREHGLELIRDLGQWWEETSGHPIPLGGIAVKRSLGSGIISQVEAAIRQSVQWGFANQRHPGALNYIKEHARELDDRVIRDHVGLYVNHYSEDLGEEGIAAVTAFLEKGREVGLLPATDLMPFSHD